MPAAIGSLLLTTAVGGFGGICSTFISDRLKDTVTAIDKELERLDEIKDLAASIIIAARRGGESQAALHEISYKRKRLGENLRRHLGKTQSWQGVSTALATFANSLKDVQDLAEPPHGVALAGAAKAQHSQEVEDTLDQRAVALRTAIKRAAGELWAWRLKRG